MELLHNNRSILPPGIPGSPGRNTGIDYDNLRKITAKKREESSLILDQISKLRSFRKAQEDQTKMNIHKHIYVQEGKKLHNKSVKLDKELHDVLEKLALITDVPEAVTEHKEWKDLLNLEYTQTLSRLKEAEELEYVIEATEASNTPRETRNRYNKLLQLLDQERTLLKQLTTEEIQLANELKDVTIKVTAEDVDITKQVLDEAELIINHSDLNIDKDLMKRKLTQHLNRLDTKYNRTLEELRARSETELGTLHKTGTWDQENHFHFIKVYQEYMHLKDMRTLCSERLCLEMPHKSKKDIEDHMQWYIRYNAYLKQVEELKNDWTNERQDFLITSKDIVIEAARLQYELMMKEVALIKEARDREKRELQLIQWNDQKLHKVMEQQEAARQHWEHQLQLQKEEEARKRKKIEKKKAKIALYKQEKKLQSVQQQADVSQRLAEEKKQAKLQLEQSKERIAKRYTELQNQQDHRQAKLREEQQAWEETQSKLQKLRDTVKPDIESDPQRVLQATESTLASKQEQQPPHLFPLHTYSSDDITSDKRYKIEQALRNAGLQDTTYGRLILANQQGNKPVRRDTLTTQQMEVKATKR